MINSTLRIAAILMVSLGLVAGCGSSGRPYELSLTGVQPCQLIPSPILRELHVTSNPSPVGIVSGSGLKGNTCMYVVRTGNRVWISTITNYGIEHWIDGPAESVRFTDVPKIQGFRTIKVWYTYDRPAPNHTCGLYIDGADEQSLRVRVDATTDPDDPPTCDRARRFAEAAMKALVTS